MNSNEETKNMSRKVTPVERFFARSPFSIVNVILRINGNVSESALKIAATKASERHINLRYRIIDDENNEPWFTTEGTAAIPVKILARKDQDDWIGIVQASNQIPFEFEKHPAIRLILVQSPLISELVISCHHIICDGMSLAYLARDILGYLGNPSQEVEVLTPPTPISLENLPSDVSMNGIVKFFMKRINKKWADEQTSFDQEDYKTITNEYWNKYKHQMKSIELTENDTANLVKRCREEKVTVNSAITTAFMGASAIVEELKPYHSKVVVASNLRNRISAAAGEGMGMFAGGVEAKYEYDQGIDFWDNAREFHKMILPKYTNKNLFKEVLTWCHLEPSIFEAMNFKKIGGIVSAGEPRYEKLHSFNQQKDTIDSILKREGLDTFGNIILGTAVTNLTRLDFPIMYGDLELERMIFKPGGAFPMTNANLLVGAVTCSGKLSLLLEYSDKNLDEKTIEEISNMSLTFLQSE